MLKKVGDISAYHESCFKNENSEKFGKSLVLDCSGGSVGIMQFKVKKMNNIAHEDLQVKYFMQIFFLYKIFLSFSVDNKLFLRHRSNLGSCWFAARRIKRRKKHFLAILELFHICGNNIF